jgi:hypothetical protein
MTIMRFCRLDISAAIAGELNQSRPGTATAPAPTSELKNWRRLNTWSAEPQE